LAGSKIDLEDTKPQTSRRVIDLHGKLKLDAQGLPSIAPTFVAAQAEDEVPKATDFAGFSRVPVRQRKRIARPLKLHLKCDHRGSGKRRS
jgi:hypothetical protein